MASVSLSKLLPFFILLMMMSLILLARLQSEDGKSVQVGRLIARGAARKDLGGKMAMDSAREVPTGPDPLHHHSYPSRP